MKLSEAIINGSTLRPESHQERFCWMDNADELRSDAWGAACEAVQPAVARFNWRDKAVFSRSMDALRAVQHQYFEPYFHMPAQCPGSQQRFLKAGGRIISNRGDGVIKVYDEGQEEGNLGGITSECDRVTQMAGMVDHLFYAHGWSREQVAEVVKWYEETRSQGVFLRSFKHYSVNQDKYVSTTVN
jgi:hypothetical protein